MTTRYEWYDRDKNLIAVTNTQPSFVRTVEDNEESTED